MHRLFVAVVLLVSASSVARAQAPGDTPGSPSAPADPWVALTVSPRHLVHEFIEMTAEVRVHQRVGVGLMGGTGIVPILGDSGDDPIRVFEVGISPRYYLTGSFRQGFELGGQAELGWGQTEGHYATTVAARGLDVAAFAGYKYTVEHGLTVEGQVGIKLADVTRSYESPSLRLVNPLLNFNAGWSF